MEGREEVLPPGGDRRIKPTSFNFCFLIELSYWSYILHSRERRTNKNRKLKIHVIVFKKKKLNTLESTKNTNCF